MRQAQHGYSFIEFGVGLFLAVVLLAISTPSISNSLRKGELRREVSNLRNILNSASLQAGLRAIKIKAVFEPRQLTVSTEDRLFLTTPYSAHTILNSEGPISVTFFSGISATPATIRFSDGADNCNLIVSIRGRIRQSC